MKHKYFLTWFLLFNLLIATFGTLYYFGVLHDVYEKDSSYISFVIMLLFSWNIFKFNKVSRIMDSFTSLQEPWETEKKKKEVGMILESGWFYSEQCLTLGMIGTVVGFIMMLGNFLTVDSANQLAITGLLKSVGYGMATALYTTLVGLICGGLLKLYCFKMESRINE